MHRPAVLSPVLALDFDGVLVDAHLECAALTLHTDKAITTADERIDLDEAVRALPASFVALFERIRPYCRTLADFMVVNHVIGDIADRSDFERARADIGPARLSAEAAVAERIRAHWRSSRPSAWLAHHDVHLPLVAVLRRWPGPRMIVSAKDADSIRAILDHHGLADLVDDVIGSCDSKTPHLRRTADQADVWFVDDNVDHVIAASAIPRVHAFWARWGHAAPEDEDRARSAGVTPLDEISLPDALKPDSHI